MAPCSIHGYCSRGHCLRALSAHGRVHGFVIRYGTALRSGYRITLFMVLSSPVQPARPLEQGIPGFGCGRLPDK